MQLAKLFEGCRKSFQQLCAGHELQLSLTRSFLTKENVNRFFQSKGDAEQAYKAFNLALIWKIESKVLKINTHSIKNSLESGKAFWHGFDRDGNPCLIIKTKLHIPRQSDDFQKIRFIVWLMEQGCEKADNTTGRLTIVFDFSDFKKRNNLDLSLSNLIKETTAICLDYYPERLAKMIFVKPSLFLKGVLALAKSGLSKRTCAKLVQVQSYQDLGKFIDEQNLLQEMGGKSKFEWKWECKEQPSEQRIVISRKVPNLTNYELTSLAKVYSGTSSSDLK